MVVVYVCVYGEGGGGLRENERVMDGSTKSCRKGTVVG